MSLLDDIEEHCSGCGIEIERLPLPGDIKAIYYSTQHVCPAIILDPSVRTSAEAACKLAEELGHHYTTHGDILTDPSVPKTIIRKAETLARRWAFQYAVSLSGIVAAWEAGSRCVHEMAEHMGIEERFFVEALETYGITHGEYATYGEHQIRFNPVTVKAMKVDDENSSHLR